MPDNEEKDASLAWEQLSNESALWYSRFVLYRDLGPVRTVADAVHLEDEMVGRKKTRLVPGSWRDASRKFHWVERAEEFDAHRRKTVFAKRYAYDLERISKLDELADKLATKIVDSLDKISLISPTQMPLYVERLESIFDALAKETGGRKESLEISGKDGGPIQTNSRVVIFMPDAGGLGNDIDVEMPQPEEQADDHK